jgi:hypothetical protein
MTIAKDCFDALSRPVPYLPLVSRFFFGWDFAASLQSSTGVAMGKPPSLQWVFI